MPAAARAPRTARAPRDGRKEAQIQRATVTLLRAVLPRGAVVHHSNGNVRASGRSAAVQGTDMGVTTVPTPITLPWTATVTLPVGTAPLLSASGGVTSGKLTASIDARASGGASSFTVSDARECSQL